MDVIAKAARALSKISERGIEVSQEWYSDNLKLPHVALTFIDETPLSHSEDEEEITEYTIQVSVFSTKDERELLKEIKKALKNDGFLFSERMQDDIDTKQKRFMQAMRFNAYEETEE